MSRRQVKEFRPDEALSLISADREGKSLRCPSCASEAVGRVPARPEEGLAPTPGRVLLTCSGCGRIVAYVALRPEA